MILNDHLEKRWVKWLRFVGLVGIAHCPSEICGHALIVMLILCCDFLQLIIYWLQAQRKKIVWFIRVKILLSLCKEYFVTLVLLKWWTAETVWPILMNIKSWKGTVASNHLPKLICGVGESFWLYIWSFSKCYL
jgi:hypothetical protein